MAYVAPADFRSETVKWWSKNFTLAVSEIVDADLAAVIAAVSDRIDGWTSDHFEPEAALVLSLDGGGMPRLYMPKRIRTITTVEIKDSGGTYTTQPTSVFEVVASTPWTSGSGALDKEDYIGIVPGQALSYGGGWPDVWPIGPNRVRVTGDFSWPTSPGVPDDIQLAVAALVYDTVKGTGDLLKRASSLRTPDADYNMIGTTTPTGLPLVDRIIAQYQRTALLLA